MNNGTITVIKVLIESYWHIMSYVMTSDELNRLRDNTIIRVMDKQQIYSTEWLEISIPYNVHTVLYVSEFETDMYCIMDKGKTLNHALVSIDVLDPNWGSRFKFGHSIFFRSENDVLFTYSDSINFARTIDDFIKFILEYTGDDTNGSTR